MHEQAPLQAAACEWEAEGVSGEPGRLSSHLGQSQISHWRMYTLLTRLKNRGHKPRLFLETSLAPSLHWMMPANTILSIFVEMVSKGAMSISSHRVWPWPSHRSQSRIKATSSITQLAHPSEVNGCPRDSRGCKTFLKKHIISLLTAAVMALSCVPWPTVHGGKERNS